eukprot:gnl/MRDRNA2_/MRDRNA2_139852_c0_seq1.p1 gnl/MRDRNA2_/MRDRNA2_139852_c0~~gnl/MRDRNA2_/MRDRNA2_139852_c0_seq1.p1  ORF type:complete len:161 (-),score=18.73 gnl/MRDRNA2_/MRDRNA2_139852_c0_seq1:266-748(-)
MSCWSNNASLRLSASSSCFACALILMLAACTKVQADRGKSMSHANLNVSLVVSSAGLSHRVDDEHAAAGLALPDEGLPCKGTFVQTCNKADAQTCGAFFTVKSKTSKGYWFVQCTGGKNSCKEEKKCWTLKKNAAMVTVNYFNVSLRGHGVITRLLSLSS